MNDRCGRSFATRCRLGLILVCALGAGAVSALSAPAAAGDLPLLVLNYAEASGDAAQAQQAVQAFLAAGIGSEEVWTPLQARLADGSWRNAVARVREELGAFGVAAAPAPSGDEAMAALFAAVGASQQTMVPEDSLKLAAAFSRIFPGKSAGANVDRYVGRVVESFLRRVRATNLDDSLKHVKKWREAMPDQPLLQKLEAGLSRIAAQEKTRGDLADAAARLQAEFKPKLQEFEDTNQPVNLYEQRRLQAATSAKVTALLKEHAALKAKLDEAVELQKKAFAIPSLEEEVAALAVELGLARGKTAGGNL